MLIIFLEFPGVRGRKIDNVKWMKLAELLAIRARVEILTLWGVKSYFHRSNKHFACHSRMFLAGIHENRAVSKGKGKALSYF